ncbi:MAG: hypothetical protein IPK71_22615 [Myxococcales bacterium]|nr:hypothetical protein [Myxococcales bacterium]MBL9112287.1 hypothetical protein [Myxococcales bacterium]
MTADATPDAIERRHAPEASAPWLFSRELDAALLVVPYLVALVAFVASGLSLSGGLPRAYAAWGSQFVLGNTTHVILTFLLLGARRDLLHAAPGQARTIIVGASLTWGVAFGSYYALDRYAPTLMDLFLAFVITLASHHTFSQSKGIWSLYAMRAPAPPSPSERTMQQRYVPVALILVMVRWLFVAAGPGKVFPFIGAVPGLEAPLPYAVTFVLAAAWGFFAVATVRAAAGDAPFYAQAKSRYVAASALAVLVMIVVPPWGSVIASGMHGIEYFLLTRRMLRPFPGEETPVGPRVVVPAMLVAIAPLLVVGMTTAPFSPRPGRLATLAMFAMNAVVLAHYFADAFTYRFRIPSVRKNALARLGFGPPLAPKG